MRADQSDEPQLHGTARQTRTSGNNNNTGERRGYDFGNKADPNRGNACFDDWKSARARKWEETKDVKDEQVEDKKLPVVASVQKESSKKVTLQNIIKRAKNN